MSHYFFWAQNLKFLKVINLYGTITLNKQLCLAASVALSNTLLNLASAAEIELSERSSLIPEMNPISVIEITQGLPQVETVIRKATTGVKASPVSDGGELIHSLTGVSAIRMGGRALDPVIRGQKETQLNVLLDGGYLHGACPNRMDPPTAYTVVDSYDRVTVIKGNRTVKYGGGGSGGTVLFERDWPELTNQGYRVDLASSYHRNGDKKEVGADFASGNDKAYIRFIAHKSEAEDYKDGNGNNVDAEYQSTSNTLLGGVRLGPNTTFEASFEKAKEEDVEFPGAMMNSPFADADNSRIKLIHGFDTGHLRQLKLEAYQSDVVHLMENSMLTSPSSSDTEGLRLMLDFDWQETAWTVGADLQNNDRDAVANMISNGMSVFSQWPGVEIDQYGIFAEAEKVIDSDNILNMGLRFDRIKASASRANETFGMGMGAHTPLSQYALHYGVTDTDSRENNIGGFVAWTHRIDNEHSLETSVSRSVRTADATERYIARNPAMGSDWIGNPQIKPEKHHQAEVALIGKHNNMQWSFSGWYNHIDDYILRYNNGSADLYANVNAELYGVEAEINYVLGSGFTLGSSLAWVRGENRDDNQPLSRIAPLELTTSLDYKQSTWSMGAQWKLVSKQNRVCLSSDSNCGGQDVRQTPGYGLVNLHAEYKPSEHWQLSMGIDNLFDKAYTLHESRDYVLDSDFIQVAEPGQSVWLRASASF